MVEMQWNGKTWPLQDSMYVIINILKEATHVYNMFHYLNKTKNNVEVRK